jgi:hypothetical protein
MMTGASEGPKWESLTRQANPIILYTLLNINKCATHDISIGAILAREPRLAVS